MGFTVPRTWADLDVVTGALLNTHLRDAISWLAGDNTNSNAKPNARLTNSAVQSIPNITWTPVTFDTERWDVQNMHTTGSRLTIPTGGAGVYLVGGQSSWASNVAGFRQAGIMKNGGLWAVQSGPVRSDGYLDISLCTLVNAVVGDYFELAVWQSSGGSLNSGVNSAFSPELWCTWQSL